MKAIVCKTLSGPDGLELQEIPSPEPGPGDVKIRVRACGLNFADSLIIQGLYQEKPSLPFVPGSEVAGEITAVGEAVTQFKVGDRVAGLCGTGGFAEEVVTSALTVLPLPAEMDFTAGAAFTIAYGTSHLALWHRAKLQPGEVLLVHGAAGGVGLTAVELGKVMGATVIATASTSQKLALAQQAGADYLINYREEDFRSRVKEITKGKGADVIYDPVGGDVFTQSMRCIAWEGRLLVIGFASGEIPTTAVNLTLVKNCSIVGVYWGAYAQKNPAILLQSLATLGQWYSQGKINPHVSQTFPLEQAADAIQVLMNRQALGKVVVTVD